MHYHVRRKVTAGRRPCARSQALIHTDQAPIHMQGYTTLGMHDVTDDATLMELL